MTIRTITDTNSDILLKCDLRSSAAVTGVSEATGTVEGTATLDGRGLATGAAGSVKFAGITNAADLADSGQISVRATTIGVAEYDDSAEVSGSQGVNRSAAAYLWAAERATGQDQGRLFINGAEQISYRTHDGDTQSNSALIHTGNKDETVMLTLSWDTSNMYLYVDGALMETKARASGYESDIFDTLIVGAAYNTTGNVFDSAGDGYFLTDLVVSSAPVDIPADSASAVSVFGDSYASQAVAVVQTPRFDTNLRYSLNRISYMSQGKSIAVDGVGHGGHTICDTASDNLNDDIASFISTYTNPNVVIFGGNNDCTVATDAQVENATTGTYARLYSWLTSLRDDGRKAVYVMSPGSLRQSTTLDTAANNDRRQLVDGEMRRCINDWLSAEGGMKVAYLPLFGHLKADLDDNHNYQGHLNTIGNATVAGVASPDDRHPSGFGAAELSQAVYEALAGTGGGGGSITGTITSTIL